MINKITKQPSHYFLLLFNTVVSTNHNDHTNNDIRGDSINEYNDDYDITYY